MSGSSKASPPSTSLAPKYTASFEPYKHFITTSSLAPSLLKSAFLLGTTPWKCSHLHPQAALYSVYIPPAAFLAAKDSGSQISLIITIHGTSRQAERARDKLVPLAEKHGAAVLAPLFPMGVGDGNDLHNYKGVLYRYQTLDMPAETTIRYDTVLFGILDEIAVRWEGVIETDRAWLTGFSGGGQFALRMWYLYPERWKGVSVGAPGAITRLDWKERWPNGVSDTKMLFGRDVQAEMVRGVKNVQLVVGERDTEARVSADLERISGHQAQRNEFDRRNTMDILKAELEGQGLRPKVDVVPGVGHRSDGAFPVVEAWLEKALAK